MGAKFPYMKPNANRMILATAAALTALANLLEAVHNFMN